jgi:hypothetical protein
MGIRIHKVLGYGLDDVQCNDKGGYIDDSRINHVKDSHGYTALIVRSIS